LTLSSAFFSPQPTNPAYNKDSEAESAYLLLILLGSIWHIVKKSFIYLQPILSVCEMLALSYDYFLVGM